MASRQSIVRGQYLKTLKRDGAVLCGLCGGTIRLESELTVDHILPKSKGGSNRVSNLQPAHITCNADKGNTTSD